VRAVFGKRRAPEFDAWLVANGITGQDGALLPARARHPLVTGLVREAAE
jgi:ethanolamine ammonia-lyase large subunit